MTNSQGVASIAALGDVNHNRRVDDGYIAVWASIDQNNDNGHIFGQRLDSCGNKVGGEFEVDNPAALTG